MQNHQSFSHLIGPWFSEEITLLYALLWDLEFSRNWWKKWVPTYTIVVAYFTTTTQPFLISRKLLAITHNHPHVIILNQKVNTNAKSPMLLTQLMLQYEIKCNTNATRVILSHRKIVKTHMVLWLITMTKSLLY